MLTPYKNEEISRLMEQLQDESPAMRLNAAFTLGKITDFPAEAVPGLLVALDDQDSTVKAQAVFSLGMLGPNAEQAVPKLQEIIEDEDSESLGMGRFNLRDTALKAVGQIKGLSFYLDQLENGEIEERWQTAHNMSTFLDDNKIGDAAEYLPRIMNFLSDEDSMVRMSAVKSLGRVSGELSDIIPPIVKALDDTDGHVRKTAVIALGEIGTGAKDVLPRLREISKQDKLGTIRTAAHSAIRKIDTGS